MRGVARAGQGDRAADAQPRVFARRVGVGGGAGHRVGFLRLEVQPGGRVRARFQKQAVHRAVDRRVYPRNLYLRRGVARVNQLPGLHGYAFQRAARRGENGNERPGRHGRVTRDGFGAGGEEQERRENE